MFRQLLLLSIIGVICAFSGEVMPAEDAEDQPISAEFCPDDEEDEFGPYVSVEWGLLRLHENRRVTHATLIVRGWDNGREKREGTRFEIDDQETLKQIEQCFLIPPLRFATVDDGRGGMGWGSINFAALQIQTTEGEFFIDIGWEGFHLNRHSTNADDVFWSGKLARLLDDRFLSKNDLFPPDDNRLTLAESHVQFLTNSGDLRPEVVLPSDSKIKAAKAKREAAKAQRNASKRVK